MSGFLFKDLIVGDRLEKRIIKRTVKMSQDKVTLSITKVTQGFSCGLHGYFLSSLFPQRLLSKHEQSAGNRELFG